MTAKNPQTQGRILEGEGGRIFLAGQNINPCDVKVLLPDHQSQPLTPQTRKKKHRSNPHHTTLELTNQSQDIFVKFFMY